MDTAASTAADNGRGRMTMDAIMISHRGIALSRSLEPSRLQPQEVCCQCSAVRFRAPLPQPLAVFHCHCRECRRQSSAAYGTSAVYPAAGVFPLDPALRRTLSVYIRPGQRSRTGRDMACFFCTRCGARVMHRYLKRRRGAEDKDGGGCGGGGDQVEAEAEVEAEDNDKITITTRPDDTPAEPAEPVDLDDEAVYDGTTVTIKGGLITGLDYTRAVHIYTEYAVVPIPAGVTQYPGTPPESP
ncbi:hypothetical protein HMPREF1624_08243 [Sporothrix schenckii ATCC 58251]|uniref:CENP-V/GFA domain-containing protein n=1 Tax=Sporothrix schenckii (strain ATCC 58251 / de Perez 2211183) TaxID=1391915 RepID=U7PLF5_SPOS1|nr:hypothetical protein HMPREF1624_08243 [Sporothrix schenckii ATCC 58251]